MSQLPRLPVLRSSMGKRKAWQVRLESAAEDGDGRAGEIKAITGKLFREQLNLLRKLST